LELGVRLIPNVPKYTSFYVVAVTFDKPAKAAVLNMKSYNGFGGCTKCLQVGETLKGTTVMELSLFMGNIT
jgi:hypothetical protein